MAWAAATLTAGTDMGLLEAFGLGSGDPDKDAAINHGLLVAGASLLGSRGRLSPNIDNAILQGLQGAQQFSQQGMQQRQAGMQQKLTQAQLDKLKADQAAEAAKRAQEEARQKQVQTFIQGIPSPEMRASQQALAPGGGPTVQNAQRMQPVDPNQSMMYGMLQNGLISPQDYFAAQNKQQAPIRMGPGDQLLDPTTYKPLAVNPKQAAENSFIAQMREAGIDPASAEGQSLLRQRLLKEASHAPAATAISYGSPMPALNPKTNEVELVRPDNKGGMSFTGVKPAPQDRDVKLPAELQRMQIAGDTMVSLLDRYEGLLKKHNPRDPMTQMNPSVRAEMQSVKRNLELQFKELQALGALAGPDIEIMRQALADPFSAQGAYYGREGLLAQAKQARDLVKMRRDSVLRSQGKPATAENADPLGLR